LAGQLVTITILIYLSGLIEVMLLYCTDVGGSIPMFHLHGEAARCQALSPLL